MSTTMRYFCGPVQLERVCCIPNAQFEAIGGKRSRANWCDSFQRLAGIAPDGSLRPVDRAIAYRRQPSLHECNAKCMGGKPTGTCECSCGGKNHGIGGAL